MKMALQPYIFSENEGKPFHKNLIRDKMRRPLGWTSQEGILLSPSPFQKSHTMDGESSDSLTTVFM